MGMGVFVDLLKLQLCEKFDLFRRNNPRARFAAAGKYVLLVAAVTLTLYLLLMRIVGVGLAVNVRLLAVVLLFTQAVSLLFAVGNIIAGLYLSRDNEILLALPVSPNQIFFSKLTVVYIQELVISAAYSLPLFFVLGVYGGFSTAFYLMIIPALLLLPALPVAAAMLLSVPVMAVVKFLRGRAALSAVIILAGVAGALMLYSSLLSVITQNFQLVERQIQTMLRINDWVSGFGGGIWLLHGFAQAMVQPNLAWHFGVYAAVAAALSLAGMAAVRPLFLKIAMGLTENSTKAGSGRRGYKSDSAFVSLIKKEFFTLMRSPGYIFQYFLFTLLMPFIVISYDKLMLSIAVSTAGNVMIAGSHILILSILAMLSNVVSASTISREGANFYLVKTAPVDYYTQTFAKAAFNAAFTLAALTVTGIVSISYLALSWDIVNKTEVILGLASGTLSVMLAALGHMLWSMDLDLKKPSLDWYDHSELSGMGGNTAKSIIWGLVLSVAMGTLVIMLAATGIGWLPWAVLFLLSLAFCLYRLYVLVLRVFYRYDTIEM